MAEDLGEKSEEEGDDGKPEQVAPRGAGDDGQAGSAVCKHRSSCDPGNQVEQDSGGSSPPPEHEGQPADQEGLQAQWQRALHGDDLRPESRHQQGSQQGLQGPAQTAFGQCAGEHQRSPPSPRHSCRVPEESSTRLLLRSASAVSLAASISTVHPGRERGKVKV